MLVSNKSTTFNRLLFIREHGFKLSGQLLKIGNGSRREALEPLHSQSFHSGREGLAAQSVIPAVDVYPSSKCLQVFLRVLSVAKGGGG